MTRNTGRAGSGWERAIPRTLATARDKVLFFLTGVGLHFLLYAVDRLFGDVAAGPKVAATAEPDEAPKVAQRA